MISQPRYIWYHIQYTCDILSTIFMTSYLLCMTTQQCVLLLPHSAYVWYNLHYIWYHINSITTNHGIYYVTSTSGMTSQPLYQTLHQLYLFHRNVSTAVTPTILWQHTDYTCDIICTIYDIISTEFMTSDLLYMRSHPQFITSHPLYLWHHSHYIGNIMTTISVNTYQIYLTWNTLC